MSIANPFFGVTDRDARSARISGFGRVRRIPVLTSMQKFRPDGVERGSKPRAPSQGLFALESVLNVASTFRPADRQVWCPRKTFRDFLKVNTSRHVRTKLEHSS